ncbi:MAG: hypothetical protein Fur0046_36120 [Cyanobacteria bacterium J069]|nr:MAG: tetratricopeptide repeat protein [Cyanobacteria bacterium J069]
MSSTDLSWLKQGQQHLQQGDPAAALEYFAQAVVTDPQNAEAWYKKGNALYALRRYDEAVDSYGQALNIRPD